MSNYDAVMPLSVSARPGVLGTDFGKCGTNGN